ncbi:diacylglycerol/lipid kinase family protein [Wansuia hejianensis]|uniref:Diacylglycerol kinase family lipid kinase n=1 Tax=Wansuia hejianensis TaxID=2763667 RepID=A0A926F0J7_9FIRM|nr:diacylglycerol kinase family protein [Wansuia hejianensis]MBC8590897.1 diacylglycerol kinase family lipid kinase [Wansuia hejianensis]
MDRLLFIINPVAGGGRAGALQSQIERTMEKNKINYDIVLTTRPKEAITIAEETPHNKVIAVGGDGTVNEVAKGLINRGHGILGIIPGGTGNDLSRSLGISMDPIESINAIIQGKIIEMDIGCANGHKFLNIASVGFDAEVVKNTESIKKKIKGKVAYILGVILTIISFRKKKVTLEIDNKICTKSLLLLAVGNGNYYGGGMKILPQANINDGYLHICLIKDVNNLILLTLFPTIFKGNHIKYKKYVEIIKSKKISIKSKEKMYFNLDGELIDGGKEINFNLSDHKLYVIHA